MALITYADWLTATLSVLSMALTILGVVIAVFAVWGYRSIREEARAGAEEAACKAVARYLDGQSIPERLKRLVDAKVESESDKLYGDLSLSFEPERVSGAGSVSEQYPPDDKAEKDLTI